MLMKKVGHAVALAALLMGSAHALVPLEGLVLGEVERELQPDPLTTVFTNGSLEGEAADRALHRNYRSFYLEAQALQQSCTFVGKASYANTQSETVARRTMVATLQYLGLDATVKAIGTYARTLQMGEDEYGRLVENLMKGSCSPNLSVYGLRLVRSNLLASYKNEGHVLPRFPGPPMSAESTSKNANAAETRETEFHYAVKNFRALCSWGGDISNYRLLPPLLSSPQVMSAVMRHMQGVGLSYDDKTRSVELVNRDHARVSCDGPICRPVPPQVFERQFPRMVGSSGLKQDFQRQWCEHFRYQNYLVGDQQSPQVREWIKRQELEDERKEVALLVSLFTNTSDIVLMNAEYKALSLELRRPIEQRWNEWAQASIKRHSQDLFFEEALQIDVLPKNRAEVAAAGDTFALDLSITMGELDRLLTTRDKLSVDFDLKVSRNWLRWVRNRALQAPLKESPQDETDAVIDSVAVTLKALMEKGYGYFPYFRTNTNLELVVATELVEQLSKYEGSYFADEKDQMVSLPVRFHYGLFALSYVRYKALQKAVPAPVTPEVSQPSAASLDL